MLIDGSEVNLQHWCRLANHTTVSQAWPFPESWLGFFWKNPQQMGIFLSLDKNLSPCEQRPHLMFYPGKNSPYGRTGSPVGKSWEIAARTKPLSRVSIYFALTEGHAAARWPFYRRWFYRKKSSGGSYTDSPSWNWSSSLAQWSWGLPEAPLSVRHSVASPVSCSLRPLLRGWCRDASASQPAGSVRTRTAGSRRPGEQWSRGAAGCSPSTWRW